MRNAASYMRRVAQQVSGVFRDQCSLPGIHPTVDKWVIHGVAHCQPVYGEIHRLNPSVFQNVRMLVDDNEADVLRQPAGSEDQHDHDHHLHYLSTTSNINYYKRC